MRLPIQVKEGVRYYPTAQKSGINQAIMGKRGGKISPATEFKKGVSGNPNGRTKEVATFQQVIG